MIAFDLQAMQSVANGERGIARYVTEIAKALVDRHLDEVDLFLWNDLLPYPPRLDELRLGDRLRSFSEVRGRSVDVLHINSPFELANVVDLMPPIRARRVVVTCYDLIPFQFSERYLTDGWASRKYQNRLGLLITADAIVTDSQSAADDVSALLGVRPDRLTVLGAGVSEQFRPPELSLVDRMRMLRATIPGIRPRFVLVPSAVDWRKNTEGAIEAFALLPVDLRKHHQLVVACKLDNDQRARFEALCHRQGVSDQVLFTGFVPDETLVLLYQSAELVVFPTFYEGFGLPVLEARKCGARVVCSQTSSLPEVLTDERAWFNPYRVDEIAESMQRGLSDASFAAILDAIPDTGFSWSEAARRLVGVYSRISSELAARPIGRAKPKLGVVCVLPPVRGPVAEQNAQLVEALIAIETVETIVIVPDQVPGVQFRPRCPTHNVAALPALWEAGDLDAVVYVLADDPGHRRIVGALEMIPGHVLLHDTNLDRAYFVDHQMRLAGRYYDDVIEVDDGWAAPVVRRAMSVSTRSDDAAHAIREQSHDNTEIRDLGWAEGSDVAFVAQRLVDGILAECRSR